MRICVLFSNAADLIISFSKRAVYDIMPDCKGIKIEEKLDFFRIELSKINPCPDNKRYILDRTLRYCKTEFKQERVKASQKEKSFLCKIKNG